MRLNGLVGKSNASKGPKRGRNTIIDQKNLINNEYRTSKDNTVWYFDYTFVWVGTHWEYVGVIIDAYDKRIVAQQAVLNKNGINTKKLMMKAMRKCGHPKGLVIHTDNGVEFTCKSFEKYLVNKGVVHSYSEKGEPTRNALIESFFSAFKRDYNPDNVKFSKQKDLQMTVDLYEHEYNYILPQSGLNFLPPYMFANLDNRI